MDHNAHSRAVTYFRWLLGIATTVSVAGNVTHALLINGGSHTAVAVAVSALAPLMLFATVHGIALAARAGMQGWSYNTALAAVSGIAITAFAFSFAALRDLAIMLGYSERMSALLPVMLDATVAVTTLMLVVLDRSDDPATAVADLDHETVHTLVGQSADLPDYPLLDPNRWSAGPLAELDHTLDLDRVLVHKPEDREAHAPADEVVRAVMDQDAEPSLDQQVQVVADQPEGQAAQGADLVPEVQRTTSSVVRAVPSTADREPVQTSDRDLDRARAILVESSMSYSAEQVAAVLVLLDAGTASRAIAEQTGISKSGVLRIKSASAELLNVA